MNIDFTNAQKNYDVNLLTPKETEVRENGRLNALQLVEVSPTPWNENFEIC